MTTTPWKKGPPPPFKTFLLYNEADLYPVSGFRMTSDAEGDLYYLVPAGPEDGDPPCHPTPTGWAPTHYADLPEVSCDWLLAEEDSSPGEAHSPPESAHEDLRRKIEERSLSDPFIRQALTRHAMGATSYEDAIGRALLSLSAAYEEQNRELFRLYRERP